MATAKNVVGADVKAASQFLKREAIMKKANLTTMKSGDRGTVAEIEGGHEINKRLNAMGIRSGTKIAKISSQLMRGPVTIALGNSQVAIGFGMAKKIIVQLEQ